MAYLPSTYIQQKGVSNVVLKQITSSKISKTTTSKKTSKNETAKYALGDQGSLTASAGSSKQLHSPIYVHETRHILTKFPSTSSDTQNKKNIGPIENETSNIFHDCGNHNHQCMMQNTLQKLLPAAYAKEPFLKKKIRKSNLPTYNNRQISKENSIQIEESYWANWKPTDTSDQKQKSSSYKKSSKNKTKSIQNNKITTSFLQGSSARRKKTPKTASLFRYNKNKSGKINYPLPPRFNDQELKIFPTLSVKTDLTYYSQEFETNRVDYDESLLFTRRKRKSNTSNISNKTDNANKESGPVSQREEAASERLSTVKSQPTDPSPIAKSQTSITLSDNSVISKTDTNLNPVVTQNSQTNIEKSIAESISLKKTENSAIHSLPFNNSSQKVANTKRKLKEQTIEPHYAAESDNEEVTELKHTDSLILACKKRSQEKPYLQQPKAIRLFKRSVPTKTPQMKNSLSPILKKDTSFIKKTPPIRLGKPGSPVIVSSKFSRKSK